MTVLTNIPETPTVHTEHQSLHRSKGKKHTIPLLLIPHVFKTVLGYGMMINQNPSPIECTTEVTPVLMTDVNIFTATQIILTSMMNTK